MNSQIHQTNLTFLPLAQAAVEEADTDVAIARPKVKVDPPPFYRVMLLNDDYTPMDFVVTVLKAIFHKSTEEAERLMLVVHEKGMATCGVYTREVAETKVEKTLAMARKAEHPLQCVMEKDQA